MWNKHLHSQRFLVNFFLSFAFCVLLKTEDEDKKVFPAFHQHEVAEVTGYQHFCNAFGFC
jgi:hypothetical protein